MTNDVLVRSTHRAAHWMQHVIEPRLENLLDRLPPDPSGAGWLVRGTRGVCAGLMSLAGSRRTHAWLLDAVSALGRPDSANPTFRLSSELMASSIDEAKLTRTLQQLGRFTRHRQVEILSGLAGITAGAIARRRFAERRHETSPQTFPPPLRELILATTVRCNLQCVGCYTESERTGTEPSDSVVDSVLDQAKRLGLFRVHLVGKGEPFLNPRSARRTISLVRRHPDLMFTVFTNGVALSNSTWADLARLPNVTMVLSINGLRETNDRLRGDGVFDAVLRACMRANAHGVPHGFSVTVTSDNYREVTSRPFLSLMTDAGNVFGLFFKYIPLDPRSPADLALSASQNLEYESRLAAAAETSRMLLVDPDIFERGLGCRSRSGALIYVDLITGSVTPCVKTPFSAPECNILDHFHDDRLAEILNSPFFRRYRAGFQRGVSCSSNPNAERNWFLQERSLDPHARNRALSLPVLPS